MTALKPYLHLTRLNKPIGILLLLWPTLMALWIAAEGVPDIKILVIFTLGVVLMRSAGCAINDYADRDVDGSVWRTEGRPLATGALQPWQAIATFIGLSLVAFILVLQLNTLTIYLSFVAALLAFMYPFMKRYTYLPQLVLGMAFGWAIPMAFAAQTGDVPMVAWLLFIANIIWTTVYDTFYAMADRADDLKIGVKSTAILFDEDDRLIQGVLQGLLILVLLLIGKQLQMGSVYYIGLIAVIALFVYQQYLVRNREPKACLMAFLNNNYVGGVLFLVVVLHYIQASP
ncbi:4-hydroxybenzoate octaprenyltransferase [Methylophaga sp. OBS3]|uniref:4-hydroxybenzoate octaprenyltransferase n=1 Tax=Methylophaga sp. OBS3 TaxID=2991934 RepID=UPI00225BB992|nr:4-hydroxybenzoate octaprenyltransferase [Methylophaga sp. OBS3]MCX4190672.1 4-hydroxybenzoate octaprenyltransferase [Methylophaga sp. OBS3]